MKHFNRQKGLTMWGWLIVISMVLYIGMQGFILLTPMVRYNSMKSIVNSLASDRTLTGLDKVRLKQAILKKTSFNDITGFKGTKEQLKFKKVKGGTEIIVHYEQRVNFYGPLDFVLTLDDSVVLGGAVAGAEN